jgi:site-specific DNA-methyltransferase (adenine-specific)
VTDVAEGPGWRLHLGRYEDVLADVTCDALLCDPPYSARTHEGQTQGSDGVDRRDLSYVAWDDGDVWSFVTSWSPRVSGWTVALTDSELIGPWTRAAEGAGRYAFAPVPCCVSGMTVRLTGDGPSSWSVYAMVSRPRSAEWLAARKAKRDARGEIKSLPGFYAGPREEQEHIGGKPLWLMRAIVRDYSEPGDVVCDPTAGGATTLLAAVIEGRTAIGAERDPETWEKAVRRLRRGFTPVFDFGGAR